MSGYNIPELYRSLSLARTAALEALQTFEGRLRRTSDWQVLADLSRTDYLTADIRCDRNFREARGGGLQRPLSGYDGLPLTQF